MDETELNQTLSGINWLFNNAVYNQIIWLGDQNYDDRRNSRHVDNVRNFSNECGFINVRINFQIDFTFMSPLGNSFSIIDNFFYRKELKDHILDTGVCHLGDNVS